VSSSRFSATRHAARIATIWALAQHVRRPRDLSSTEYLYVTVWENVESIQAFAGERWQEAVIAPDEEHLLKDTWIEHYEAIDTSG
jgi:heme-degrading monooxygenase HmoA